MAVDDVRASGSNGSGTQTVISFIITTAPAGTLQTTQTVTETIRTASVELSPYPVVQNFTNSAMVYDTVYSTLEETRLLQRLQKP